jgi:hypothetical protein
MNEGKSAMQFTLYTDKSVSQCLKDLTERIHAKSSKSTPDLGGWVDKDGSFGITLTSKVLRRFNRTTKLTGNIFREQGVTTIAGYVSDGVSPSWMRILAVLLIIACGIVALNGELMVSLVMATLGAMTYIPLHGDYVNSDALLVILERTLKADPKPPKK